MRHNAAVPSPSIIARSLTNSVTHICASLLSSMFKAVRIAVTTAFMLAGASHAQVTANSNDPNMKVEMKSTDMKAVKCGEAVLVNVHGTLSQMGPPQGGDPETCDVLKFTMSNLTAVHKQAFKGMKNVETISLWGNQIFDLHEDTFKDTKNLKHLMLGGNRFKTLPANIFRKLSKLTFLDFYAQADLVSLPISVFDSLTSLEKLYIADIKLTEDELELGLLNGPSKSLQHLSLGNNRIARLPGKAFKDMKALTTLSMASNKITKIVKEDMEPMRELTGLASLLLDKNPLYCCDIDETLPEGIVKGLRAACPNKPCLDESQADKDDDKDEDKGDDTDDAKDIEKVDKSDEKDDDKDDKDEKDDTRDEL